MVEIQYIRPYYTYEVASMNRLNWFALGSCWAGAERFASDSSGGSGETCGWQTSQAQFQRHPIQTFSLCRQISQWTLSRSLECIEISFLFYILFFLVLKKYFSVVCLMLCWSLCPFERNVLLARQAWYVLSYSLSLSVELRNTVLISRSFCPDAPFIVLYESTVHYLLLKLLNHSFTVLVRKSTWFE